MALKDWSAINPQNIRKVTVPLEIDAIKEFFENKELFFVVDYSQSKVKGNMFLTYLSNLDLPCEIMLTGSSTEDKYELLRIYMETRNLSSSDVLRLNAADIILTYKGVDTSEMFNNPAFTPEEKAGFIEKHKDLIRKWDQFLYSSLVYLIKSFPALNEVLKVETQFREVNDNNFVGLNVVNLFSIPGFTEFYFATKPQEELCYFKPQFEEYMFKGKNFFNYFNCEENTMMLLLQALLNNTIKPQELVDYLNTQET